MSSPAERAQRPASQVKEVENSTLKLCSKCGTEPASANHDWCKKCKAAYQREYTGTVMDVAERRGFAKGAEAMRAHLVELFGNANPGGLMRAGEVATFIAGTQAPKSEQ